MAFNASYLRSIAFGAAPLSVPGKNSTLWHYITNDAASVVSGDDYFLDATTSLQVGDFIFCSCDIDGTPDALTVIVKTNTGSALTTAT